jgi:hypothetical protein
MEIGSRLFLLHILLAIFLIIAS